MSGPDVEAWSRIVGAPTSVFDAALEQLTRMWQSRQGLVPDGIVGPKTRAVAATAATVPPPAAFNAHAVAFIEAKNFTRGRYGSPITVVVIHMMESQEKPSTARNVALWFAGDTAPQASAHFNVDANEVVQCVRETDMAWGAPYANRNGLHIEHAGRAAQTAEQWADAYSDAMLRRSAALVASLCRKHGIPVKRIGPDELKAGGRGICGHDTVSAAFPVKGAHTDPGKSFPWGAYIELVMDADGISDKPHVA
jgi:N-acetyl-anhydromuramyl-L-alanine amidase AmpD